MLGRESIRSHPGECGTARDWRVTGQKAWTTWAHLADFAVLLARTDPDAPEHKGLTYFLIAMRQPGVQVLPLRHIGGEADFNEVFLDSALMPGSQRVGDIRSGSGGVDCIGGVGTRPLIRLARERSSRGLSSGLGRSADAPPARPAVA
jgi:hypothetical protein